MELVFFTGTRRCREPGLTLEMITPLLSRYGITRLADITGLDFLGVRVAQAVRPAAATVAVSQGKGATPATALVSAAMEAIELHHAEECVPPADRTCPAADLELGYELTGLDMGPGSLVTGRTVLEWIDARGAVTGGRYLVPRDLVWLGQRSPGDWRPGMIRGTSSGLGAGNSRAEAIAHACFELAERDAGAVLAAAPAGSRRLLDLSTVPDGWCAGLVRRIRSAGAWLEVAAAPGRFSLPGFVAWLWAEDTAASLAVGAGTHADPAIALSRAVTEAAQSRLTVIAGARDDISGSLYAPPGAPPAPPARGGRAESWEDLTAGLGWSCRTDEEEAAGVARQLRRVTGTEPMVVDLAARPELAVVKVVCPGLASCGAPVPWLPADAA